MSGSSRSLPTGRRVKAMMLALEASRMNFIQRSVRIAVDRTPSMPALPQSTAKASARALFLPSSSPNTMRITVPVWRMTPGSAMVALMLATPPITAVLPRIGASRSEASTPFCSGMTAVFRGHHRLDRRARAFDVPQFHAKQHDIDRADSFRVVGRLRGHEVRVAARAFDLESLAFHRRKMRAAGDEGDVGARL